MESNQKGGSAIQTYLGIDLGGTNIAAAVVTADGRIHGRASVPTPRGTPAGAVAGAMLAAGREALGRSGCTPEQLVSAGIGSPGTVDPDEGMIRRWYKMGFQDVPILSLLADELRCPLYLENDANCAALGEYAAGAGKGASALVAVTLGTGVGGGAVLEGAIYTGFNHAGMELGHMAIVHGGRQCACGRRGCFEAYASASALIARTKQCLSLPEADGQTAFRAAEAGDARARQVVEEYTAYLACGVVNLVNLFQPEVVCIGGGIAGQGERLLAPVREILERENYARGLPRRTRLVQAALGNDAGVIGAALLPLYR